MSKRFIQLALTFTISLQAGELIRLTYILFNLDTNCPIVGTQRQQNNQPQYTQSPSHCHASNSQNNQNQSENSDDPTPTPSPTSNCNTCLLFAVTHKTDLNQLQQTNHTQLLPTHNPPTHHPTHPTTHHQSPSHARAPPTTA